MRDELGWKMELAESVLRDHHEDVAPDPGFVTRVQGRLPIVFEPLRWAAVRILPAGLALALMLGMLVWRELPASGAAPTSMDELAAWMVDPFGVSTP